MKILVTGFVLGSLFATGVMAKNLPPKPIAGAQIESTKDCNELRQMALAAEGCWWVTDGAKRRDASAIFHAAKSKHDGQRVSSGGKDCLPPLNGLGKNRSTLGGPTYPDWPIDPDRR